MRHVQSQLPVGALNIATGWYSDRWVVGAHGTSSVDDHHQADCVEDRGGILAHFQVSLSNGPRVLSDLIWYAKGASSRGRRTKHSQHLNIVDDDNLCALR
jgi:hypothetical protein